jgi:hypothetical protein
MIEDLFFQPTNIRIPRDDNTIKGVFPFKEVPKLEFGHRRGRKYRSSWGHVLTRNILQRFSVGFLFSRLVATSGAPEAGKVPLVYQSMYLQQKSVGRGQLHGRGKDE